MLLDPRPARSHSPAEPSGRRRRRGRGKARTRLEVLLTIEPLERRIQPATVTWSLPGGGNWSTPADWSTGNLPGPTDDVVIPSLTTGSIITHSAGSDTVHSITSNANLTLSGGTLNVTGNLQESAGTNVTLQGGTLSNATLTSGSNLALTSSGGTLAGVTVAAGGVIDGSVGYNSATVSAGLTLNGSLNLGKSDGSNYSRLYFTGSQSITGSGTVNFSGNASNALYARGDGGSNPATLTVASGITVQGGSGSLTGYFNNDSVALAGTINIPSGQSLTLGGASWTNSGTINAAGATVALGGSFNIASLGSFNANAANVELTGTLNNAGTTLNLAPALGNWALQGGTLNGGTIVASSGSRLALTNSGGNLVGVTIAAGAIIDGSVGYNSAYISGGLVLNGTLNLGKADGSNYSRLYFTGTQSITGSGTVNFSGNASNALYARGDGGSNPATLTVASGITVQGGSGSLTGYFNNDSVALAGTINIPSGQTLTIGGVAWTNSGTINAAGATVALGGSFTIAELGSFNANAANVQLTGTLNNAGTTLNLAPALGNWALQGGTLNGGTITASGGSRLALTNSGGTLASVTVAAGAIIDGSAAYNSAYVSGGLVLNGTLNLGKADGSTYSTLYFAGTQAITGSGTINLGNNAGNTLYARGNNGSSPATLTIASSITVQGGSGTLSGYYSTYSTDTVILAGTINIPSGQSLTIGGVAWTNSGTINAAGATVALGGSFTIASLGSFNANAANVQLTGTLNNAGTTLNLAPALGNWALQGGTLNGGTITASGGSRLALTNSGGTLASVTVAAGAIIDGSAAYNSAYVSGGLVLNGTLNLGKADGSTYSTLYFAGTQAITGSGTINLGNSAGNTLYARGNNGSSPATLTIASSITVQGGSGTLSGYYSTYSTDTVILAGTINVPSGQSLTIGGVAWTNSGTINAAGATVALGGSFNIAELGSFNANAANVQLTGTLNNAGTTLNLAPALGNWALQGGTLNGGTITASGGSRLALTNSGGTLASVTVAAGAIIDGSAAYNSAYVSGGLVLNGMLNLGKADGSTYSTLYFAGTQAITGSGTINLGNSAGNTLYARGNNGSSPATLTIASGITVQGGSGTLSGYYSTYSTDTVILAGTINIPSGQTLTIGGVAWTNTGTINAAGATVALGGSFTIASLGSFNANAANVQLTGTLNNAGTTLNLAPALGNWALQGGTLNGGTITASGGSRLALTNSGGTLASVTVAAGAIIDGSAAYSTANVSGGLVLNGMLNLGKADGSTYSRLYFIGSQTISGSGTVNLGTSAGNALYAEGNNGSSPATLTIASGITVQGGSGTLSGYYSTYSTDTVILAGTINIPSGQTLTIGGVAWTNSGTINAAGATVALGGSFNIASLGSFNANAANVELTGTLNNAGTTLNLAPALGNWALQGGTLNGGTIVASSGSRLALTNSGGNLVGVTIAAGAIIDGSVGYNSAYISGGLVLNGTLNLGKADGSNYSRLYFTGTQSITGSGTINLGGNASNEIYAQGINSGSAGSATLTIASGITVQGGSGILSGYYTASGNTDNVVLLATLNASNGGTINLPPSLHVGASAIVSMTPDSVLVVGGNLLLATQNPALFNPRGTVTLNGPGTSAAPVLLEAMGADVGKVAAGFTNNFAYGTLILGSSTYVKLVDQSDNSPGTSAEAVYANSLVVPAGATLNLNGLNLYVRDVQLNGTITGGTLQQIPDTGPLALNSPTPGRISVAGELDNWTFYARAGRSLTVTLDPGRGVAGGPVSPTLQWAQVQLLDPSNHVLATVSSTTAGALLTLSSASLPADGTYTIAINAAPGHTASVGNYVVAAYDVTASVQPLNVNQTVTGTLATPYANDQWTFSAAAGTQVQFNLLGSSASGLVFNLTGPGGFSGFTNLTGSSTLVTLPTSGTYTLTAQGTGGAIGNVTFAVTQTSQTPLTLGTPYNGTLTASGQAQLFLVNVAAGQSLTIQLTDPATGDHDELYAQLGAPPTRATYDYGANGAGSSQGLLVPLAAPGTWYILVYGERVPSSSPFTLLATAATVKLTGLTPDHAGNSAPATLTIAGAGFVAGTTVALVAADGTTTYAPSSLSLDSFSQITATFPANLPPGVYSVRATNAGGTSTLAGAFTLSANGSAHLVTSLVLPSALGRHATATLYVTYANTGTVAMPAPLLVLSNPNNDRPLLTLDATRLQQGFWTSAIPDGFSTSLSILASGKTPGVLQPGESVSVPVYYAGLQQPWDFSHTTVPFNLGVVTTTDATPIDWNALKSSLQPNWIGAAAWSPIFASVIAQAGTTSGGYVQLLDSNAQALGHLGESVTDVGQLWNFAVLQADGLSPVSTLDSAVDASMVTPGLALSFGRSFGETINSRYQMGGFGLGWSVPWQASLATLPDGTVVVTTDGGNQFRYQPDSRHPGQYFSAAGDMDMLMSAGGGKFAWEQMDGTVTGFRADGKLDYVQDTNGNKITAGYNASGQLASLTHSSGQALTIGYNAAGLIASITDSAGRQALYTYDAANLHLLSVQTPAGTTQYGYSIGNGAATENALTSILLPDGSHRYFTYDSLGRLASTSRDGNAARLNYTYEQPGEVTATDLLGDATHTFFNELGLPVKTQDGLGNSTIVAYDPKTLMVSKITDPSGQTETFTYDAMGDVTSSTDALGHKTVYTYGPLSRLTSLTDANGNRTTYAYDPAGNPLSTTYANGAVESTTFDPLGNPLSFTNRRGQAIGYTTNAAGQVTRQTFPDSSHTDFTYDSHGNLKTAVDATGTITFTYNAADQLTRVDYPGGRFLQFTLDAAGRRTRMVDQTGFTVNYAYDAAGRLSGLKDGGNAPIVTYTYDAAGRLSRKDNGNGTSTTYQYDPNGNVLHLVNFAPGGVTVNSRFDYTYDALGRRTTMATLDGTWTYSYDGTGQLTHAVFASTNGSIPNQDLAYSYDALGNRTSTLLNGVSTAYAANNLNQYTSIGGVAQQYDADGNLLNDGTNTYTYDVLDRLTSVTTPAGTTTYTYDALGNRSSSTTGGQVTQFLNDPTGMTDVVGEFDGAGTTIAHDTYGIGLTTRTISGGNTYFYDSDAIGNVVGLSNSVGSYSNIYRYNPFGSRQSLTEVIGNPFQFQGNYGSEFDQNGLILMRSREYSATQGRFLTSDPTGFSGGDNLYRFADNSPTNKIDPTGEFSILFYVQPPPSSQLDYEREAAVQQEQKRANSQNEAICSSNYGLDAPWQWLVCTETGASLPSIRDCLIRGKAQQEPDNANNPFWGTNEWSRHINCWFFPTSSYPPLINPKNSSGQGSSSLANSFDPNDKIGPAGFGTSNFVQAVQPLPYRIDFENATTATAPAQAVTITDQLDPSLDWNSFRLTEVAFGDTTLSIPANSEHFQTTVSMTLNGKTFNVLVEAGIHGDTGQVFATFQSLDPTTQLPPDVLTGFLPPEDGTGRGMGHVSYTVQARSGLPTGTQIRNVALITFDQNDAIATDQKVETDPSQGTDPTKMALVTLDAVAPTSSVAALPATTTSATFTVSWSGTDDAGGSGVATYDVYVAADGGPFAIFLAGTTATSASFAGASGHSYGFYSVATDQVGNRQATPTSAQAATQVAVAPPTLPDYLDHGQAGYAETGTWATAPASYNATGYNNNNWRYIAGTGSANNAPNATASWQVNGLSPGNYDIEASWFADPNRADNSPYRIYDGSTLVATVRINQKLAPTGSTFGGVPFQSLGSFAINSGTLNVVVGNDADGYVIADAIRLDVGFTPVPAFVDHGQPGYAESGAWTTAPTSYNATGYNNNNWRFAAGTGSANNAPTATASWQVPHLAPGNYEVDASWFANANRADNTPYRIYDGSTLVATVRVNQKLAPTGSTFGGVPFQSLGSFAINSGTLNVVVGNDADGYVIADAIRLDVGFTPVPAFVDHGQPGYAESGAWTTAPTSYNATGYNNNNWRFAAGTGSANNAPTATATWQVTQLAPNTYEVDVSWFANPNRADNTPYRIYDGNTLIATVRVNQTIAPSGSTFGGVAFQSLGSFAIGSGTLKVVVGNDADGYVIADAIRINVGFTPVPAFVDHGQGGYAETGTWATAPTSYNATGYNNNNWRYVAGTGSANNAPNATATWQVNGLAPGNYEVDASWFANPNRADNAPYRIYDGNTLVATVRVNQKLAPTGSTFGGVPFQSLGSFAINGGILRVVLGNDADGYVIADAVRIANPASSAQLLIAPAASTTTPATDSTSLVDAALATWTSGANGTTPTPSGRVIGSRHPASPSPIRPWSQATRPAWRPQP